MGKSLVPWFFLTHSVYCVEWDAEPQLNHMCVYLCICINSDVRRLIVAMSRARLGLYVFARVSLFQNCFELTPAFNQLMVRPLKLFLAPDETYPPARKVIIIITCTHTHTHPFNGPLSGTTRVSHYQKDKTNLDFTEARDSEWQWHQLGHMQVCTSLQKDNYASNPQLSFLQAWCPDVLCVYIYLFCTLSKTVTTILPQCLQHDRALHWNSQNCFSWFIAAILALAAKTVSSGFFGHFIAVFYHIVSTALRRIICAIWLLQLRTGGFC